MRKILSFLTLAMAPTLTLAGGNHSGGHASDENPSVTMPNSMQAMQSMHGHMHSDMDAGHDDISNYGKPGNPASVSQVVEISMSDSMRFTPNQVKVKAGETVRFLIKNEGNTKHELVLGSLDTLQSHAAMMRAMPDMQHAENNMITLKPNQRGGIVWQFDHAGTVDFACLVPGHMEAGMVGKVLVE